MSLLNYLNRPEYLLQPWQIYRRFTRLVNHPLNSLQTIQLPWGLPLQIRPHPDDKVEWSLWSMGVYDLALSESLWRFIEPGETVLDIGANIGYITSLMVIKVGKTGKVIAFEPNPEAYQELTQQVVLWNPLQNMDYLDLKPLALSNQTGTGILKIPKHNRGEAALIAPDSTLSKDTLKTYEVTLDTIDNLCRNYDAIDVVKIDIEGHELSAFQGAIHLLKAQKIRDIFYEDHFSYPSPVSDYLESFGYTIFKLWKGFWKPLLYPKTYPVIHPWEPPNYLATLDPERAHSKLKSSGWSILKNSSSFH